MNIKFNATRSTTNSFGTAVFVQNPGLRSIDGL